MECVDHSSRIVSFEYYYLLHPVSVNKIEIMSIIGFSVFLRVSFVKAKVKIAFRCFKVGQETLTIKKISEKKDP